MAKLRTEIYSIYGQIEEVVANMMIQEGKITRIPREQVPASQSVSATGVPVKFAVIVSPRYNHEFNERIANLRA